MIIDNLLKDNINSKKEAKILKKGGQIMNKNLFKKVICFVIALMMVMPNMPATVFAEEIPVTQAEEPNVDNEVQREEPPIDETVEEPPVEEPPVEEPPVEEPPVEGPPVEEPPVEEPPVEEPPVEEPPVEEPPVEEPLVEEPPIEEPLVEEQAVAGPLSLTAAVDGVDITVSGMEGVLPEDTTISVVQIPEDEAKVYIEALKDDIGISLSNYFVLDITLLDVDGNEVQPNGEVTVDFDNVGFAGEDKDVSVYHIEPGFQVQESSKNLNKAKRQNKNGLTERMSFNDMSAKFNGGKVSFNTNHFSIYIVGENDHSATYEFYDGGSLDGGSLVDTQIVFKNGTLLEPPTPGAQPGKKFIGWFIEGSETAINFNETISVIETSTIRVEARYAYVWYVYFMYDSTDNSENDGDIIATKEVAHGVITNADDVPLVVNIPGKAFSHWSTGINGTEAFNFNTQIMQDTTLYAVLADRWTVTFDTNGGTTVLPKYVVQGGTLGETTTPIRAGYTFHGWNTAADGTGDDYNSSSIVNDSITLYAIWQPDSVNYTVAYWLENANDSNYSFKEIVSKTGTTNTTAIYDIKTYDGFHLNTTKTDANNVTILGDGTAVKHVYYDRDTYTLTFKRKGNSNTLRMFNNIKQGADTSPQWNIAVAAYPTYTWYVSNDSNNNIAYSLAPDMPNSDLTVYGKAAGNTEYAIYYLEDATGIQVHTPYFFTGDGGLYLTQEDYIAYPGFTVKSKPNDGSQNSHYNDNTGKREWKIYYTRNKYSITFQKNDSTGNAVVAEIPYQADISNKALSDYTVDVTTRSDGYIFKGWYEDETTLGDPFIFAEKTMPPNNMILYAKWSPPVHTVKYYLSPGTGSTFKTITNIPHGDKITVGQLIGKEIPSGLTENNFLDWYWYVDGVFVPYDFNLPINNDSVVLYPVWDTLSYTVSYDANVGTGTAPIDSNTYKLGAKATVLGSTSITPPTGKVFIGWNTESNGSGINYYPNDEITIAGNITLYAQWGDQVPNTQLTYYGNGGKTGTDGETIHISLKNNETHVVKLGNTFTLEGYEFIGWNTKADGSGISISPGESIVVDNESSIPNELHCQWAKKITVTANDQNKAYGDVFTFAGTEYTVTGEFLPGDSITSITLTSTGACQRN